MRHQVAIRAVGWTALAIITGAGARVAAQASPAWEFHSPSAPLSTALRNFAVQTGVNVIAPDELVSGRTAAPIDGRLGAREALETLLRGTGLTFRQIDDGFVISPSDARSKDRSEGLGADAGTIFVTGTNVRGAQPTSPVLVLNRKDIERSGATSVDELMRSVPQNAQGGVNKENALIALPDADVTDHGAGLNLRGLGQRATLVLLNGRRTAPSGYGSFVDVSLIPVSAIERVEILTDGASAIYGSDAVGGVVNFITKNKFDGADSIVQAGATTRGGGKQLLLAQTVGRRWTGGSGLISYQFRAEDEVLAGQRPFTINLKPTTSILPRERTHSVLANLEQEIGAALGVGLTATYAHRDTRRTDFLLGLPVGVAARAQGLSIAGAFELRLPNDWLARAETNYSLSTTAQKQTQPGGIPLINSRDVRNQIIETGLKLDGSLAELPAGQLRVALGTGIRWERYRDAFESSFFARSVKAADRNILSAFGELAVPLFSPLNRRSGLERLQLSAAIRYDRYGHTGSTVDPKIGLSWSPLKGLSLRGNYSRSFRAPLLSEITGAYNALYTPAGFLYAIPSQAPAGSIALFLQGSNPDVRPERSRSWTFGADWSPPSYPGLAVKLNYYSIRFVDRIGMPSPFVNIIGNPAFAPIVNFNPSPDDVVALVSRATSVFDLTGVGVSPADVDVIEDDRTTNTAFSNTRGLDFFARYEIALGRNDFDLSLNVNRILKFNNQLTPASPIVQAYDRVYRPLGWRSRAGVSWKRAAVQGNLFVNYANAYVDDRTPDRPKVAAYTTIDGTLGIDLSAALRGARLTVYGENLLDSRPPRLSSDASTGSGIGYDPVNASARGRFLSVQLRKSW